MKRDAPVGIFGRLPGTALVAVSLLAAALSACGAAQVNRHGHVFIDVDLNQIQPGMSKEEVTAALGSPDTTSTIDNDTFYYIATTQKSYAFLKPWEIDRKVVAVHFAGDETVQRVDQYGLKDGIVVRYAKDETPARGKDLSVIEQIFGNISQRSMFKDQRQQNPGGIPGPGPGR